VLVKECVFLSKRGDASMSRERSLVLHHHKLHDPN